MGFFTNIGKTFRHIGQTLSKGVHDGFTIGKKTASGLAAFTRRAERGLSVVNKAIQDAENIPVLGGLIKTADSVLTRGIGFSPIEALKTTEKGLGLFNKLEGKLHQANSVQEFLQQNKGEIGKILNSPQAQKLIALLRGAI